MNATLSALFRIFVVVLGGILTTLAPAAFAQATSEYSPLVHNGYTGFKDKYSPVAGAVGSILARDNPLPGTVSLFTTHGSFSLSKTKIFVPPGAKGFAVSVQSYAVDEEARAAAKFKAVPTSGYADVRSDTSIADSTKTLERLVAGEELRFYALPRSGGLNVAFYDTTSTFKAGSGGYIYLNFLQIPGGSLISFQTTMYVDESCYVSWYASATWDQAGNPSESATHTCSGSTGGGSTGGGTGGGTTPTTGITLADTTLTVGGATTVTTVRALPFPSAPNPSQCSATSNLVLVQQSLLGNWTVSLTTAANSLTAATNVTITCGTSSTTLTINPSSGGGSGTTLTDINLSATTLTAGSASTITLTPVPATATLPTCAVTSLPTYITVTGATVSVNTAASSLTAASQQTIVCGSISKTVTVNPSGSQSTASVQVITGSDNKVTLRITLTRGTAEQIANAVSNIWLGARIPQNAFFFADEVWFFRTPAGWAPLASLDANSVAFVKDDPVTATKVIDLPIGFTRTELSPFKVEVHVGYTINNGTFKNLGKVWGAAD